MYLYGKNSVWERLRADPASIQEIFVQEGFAEPQIVQAVYAAKIPIQSLPRKELARFKQGVHLQGILAKVKKFAYQEFDDLLSGKNKYTFLFLDRVMDPHNLGAILRTAACLGGFAVVLPKHQACEVTDAVLHVASGGENYVPVTMVGNLAQAIIRAKKDNYWIAGAVVEGGETVSGVKLPFPLGLVLGSEGEGVRYGVEKHLDLRFSIPMHGAPLSFNVTTAAAIICYEVARQRR